MPTLESRMVLHRFMCHQFGYKALRSMLKHLKDEPEQLDESRGSLIVQVLLTRLESNMPVSKEDLAKYDNNIIAHSQTLGMTHGNNKTWKPFQFIALLFTERYLDLYFQDPEALVERLNEWIKHDQAKDIPDYTVDNLRTLAFQSATGSGKTLLLYANILQYRHYLNEHKLLHKLNKIILVTPDEGLSRQHQNELKGLKASNIAARLFSDEVVGNYSMYDDVTVDIIDLHKLDEKKGIKRVALESFEDNNLVLVDEGHLGTGGKVWRKRRKQLAKNGFTFEYSATFNQAVSGNSEGITEMRNEYGKSILFDYSYKFFYEDGYGKDYKISNLQRSDDGEANSLYLLACLLTFYQQCRIYTEKGGQWQDYNLAPPLWVFLGKTVTGGKLRGDAETDVIKIIKFLAWVQSNQREVLKNIKKLVSDNTGLIDEKGADIFSTSFSYIEDDLPKWIYNDLCSAIFHEKGRLYISHLTGTDELQLSAGDAIPYGVINVGDASGLYTKLEAIENPLFSLIKIEPSVGRRPLFNKVDSDDNSPVKIVIGARKFAAGWNSWRVSTMGLMHVGMGEGPEIIQMFGRGVRLKGRGMSLKRHTKLEGRHPDDADKLKLLETLNIFGLKANYMAKFREYLQKEGVGERVSFSLPVDNQFGKTKGLKILKKRDKVGEFQYSAVRFELPTEPMEHTISLDYRSHLQILESEGQEEDRQTAAEDVGKLEEKHLSLLNRQVIYHKVLESKRRFQWHNMTISKVTIDALLDHKNDGWYQLYISPEKLELSNYGRVREWEDLAVDLISEYANQYWRKQRSKWEHEHMEAAFLAEEHANYITSYKLEVDAKEKELLKNIEQLIENVKNNKYDGEFISGKVKMSLLSPSFHAYKPLLYAKPHDAVHIFPVPLNRDEADFVEYLEKAVKRKNLDIIQSKEIYLMRNLSRGKGVSFFDDYHFYPDFILWVKDKKRQDILFIDPKGLVHVGPKVMRKIELHTRIKETQKKLKKKNPELFLHSYIWSHTKPKEIGFDKSMTPKERQEKGIFLAQDKEKEIIKLLEDALS